MNPYILMMKGQPVYTYGQHPPCEQTFDQVSHFLGLLRGRGSRDEWNNIENSTKSTAHSLQSVLLKADTGADV